MLTSMENNRSDPNSFDFSPGEAKEALEAVSGIRKSVEWSPRPWAIVIMALIFMASVTAAVWDLIGWAFGFLALFALLFFLLRCQLVNPYVRERPWQQWDRENQGQQEKWWLTAGWSLWVPLTILLPPEPRWIGLILGVLAGVHVYYAFKTVGTSSGQ